LSYLKLQYKVIPTLPPKLCCKAQSWFAIKLRLIKYDEEILKQALISARTYRVKKQECASHNISLSLLKHHRPKVQIA